MDLACFVDLPYLSAEQLDLFFEKIGVLKAGGSLV